MIFTKQINRQNQETEYQDLKIYYPLTLPSSHLINATTLYFEL